MDRVLEIGGFAAAYAGRQFVRAGADVVRVESRQPPAWASRAAMEAYLHAGKRRLATADPELVAQLASRADIVVVEAETAEALSLLGFAEWQTPVKVALTPFGLTGPRKNWQATPNVLLAMGGYTNLMGDPDKAPLSLPGHYLEFQTGGLGYTAANACRLAGDRNVIDIGMLETVASLSQFTTVRWHCAGEIRSRHGSDFWFVVPSNLFACRDGWVYINIVPTFWDAFTVLLDKPELLVDDRFATNDTRMSHRDALHDVIADVIRGMTKQEIGRRADEARVPLGIVQGFDDVLADAHLAERMYWESIEVEGEKLKSPALPYRINGAPPTSFDLLPPESGEQAPW